MPIILPQGLHQGSLPNPLHERGFRSTFQAVVGPVAHLVERFHGMEEVVGSSPIRSIETVQRLAIAGRCALREVAPTQASVADHSRDGRRMVMTILRYIR